MKIPQQLPQFDKDKVLLAATSKKEAEIYLAGNGELIKLGQISVDQPRYSDREGFFIRRGKGKVFGSGAVYEKKKEKVEHEFAPVFSRTLRDLFQHYEVSGIYLFSPAYQIKFIESAMPNTLAKNIRLIIKNNFFKRHPFRLLEKIQKTFQHIPVRAEKIETLSILQRRNIRPSFSV